MVELGRGLRNNLKYIFSEVDFQLVQKLRATGVANYKIAQQLGVPNSVLQRQLRVWGIEAVLRAWNPTPEIQELILQNKAQGVSGRVLAENFGTSVSTLRERYLRWGIVPSRETHGYTQEDRDFAWQHRHDPHVVAAQLGVTIKALQHQYEIWGFSPKTPCEGYVTARQFSRYNGVKYSTVVDRIIHNKIADCRKHGPIWEIPVTPQARQKILANEEAFELERIKNDKRLKGKSQKAKPGLDLMSEVEAPPEPNPAPLGTPPEVAVVSSFLWRHKNNVMGETEIDDELTRIIGEKHLAANLILRALMANLQTSNRYKLLYWPDIPKREGSNFWRLHEESYYDRLNRS